MLNTESTPVLSVADDTERRFGGLQRLYGSDANKRLANAHVAVAGIGGVGSWAAEALARSGVGALTLIDLDHIAPSNVNRQVHALDATFGQSKVVAMAERIRGITPHCRLHLVDDFVEPENIEQTLAGRFSVIIDATDQVKAKIAMVLHARRQGHGLIVCGGAGGKTNPLALRAGDLAQATHDALLARVRNELRRHHGYPRGGTSAGKSAKRPPRMNVRVLWVDEPARRPALLEACDVAPAETGSTASVQLNTQGLSSGVTTTPAHILPAPQGLSCAGYGSVITVTATMGLVAANEAMNMVLNRTAHS